MLITCFGALRGAGLHAPLRGLRVVLVVGVALRLGLGQ